MPIAEIASASSRRWSTLRKQVIEDIYQIMGLSDIMRGATDPRETLGAQQLKTPIRLVPASGTSSMELVRIARDLVDDHQPRSSPRSSPTSTIIEMSQTQLPTQGHAGAGGRAASQQRHAGDDDAGQAAEPGRAPAADAASAAADA